jgi:hypothetical protein
MQERRPVMRKNELNGFDAVEAEFPAVPPALELDHEKYMDDLAEFDMTDAQKRELLETLWAIMRHFVELGFSGNVLEPIFGNGENDVYSRSKATTMEKTPGVPGPEES